MPQTNPKAPMASLVKGSVRATEEPAIRARPGPLPSPFRPCRKSPSMHHPYPGRHRCFKSKPVLGTKRRASEYQRKPLDLRCEVYHKMYNLSEGFDVPDLPKQWDHPVKPMFLLMEETLDDVILCCKKAVEDYREKEGIELEPESIEILKSNMELGVPINFYITFAAKDKSGELGIYQTFVGLKFPKDESKVFIMRRKPWITLPSGSEKIVPSGCEAMTGQVADGGGRTEKPLRSIPAEEEVTMNPVEHPQGGGGGGNHQHIGHASAVRRDSPPRPKKVGLIAARRIGRLVRAQAAAKADKP